jgi:hypothetical protein
MKPVNSTDKPSVISTSNLPPKSPRPPALARTSKTDKLPRLANRNIKRDSDEDSSSSSPRESSTSSSHTNPHPNKQTSKTPVTDSSKLDAIYRNGKPEDQFKYGQMYEEGNGVDRDFTKALMQKLLTGIKEQPIKIIQKRSTSLAGCTPMA